MIVPERVSALDASFLAVESPLAPMHVGWVASFDPPEHGPPPSGEQLAAHIAARMQHAHRYRQRLADVPLGVHDPVWIDDPDFDATRHVHAAADLDIDAELSRPLARDRPLWEFWVTDELTMLGKAHHCMVDGLAIVELGNLLLDADPGADGTVEEGWEPQPAPTPGQRLGRAIADRIGEAASLVVSPLRLAANVRALPSTARMATHTLLPPAPGSPLNARGSGQRRQVRLTRKVAEIRRVRKRYGVTPNDVVLAACAGGLHRHLEEPQALKVMVPADVRSADDSASGNRISFVFHRLPSDEPDPVRRLHEIHRLSSQRRREGDAEQLDAAFRMLALTPGPVQRTLAHAFAHPRLFNLTISSVPGPAVTRYLRGCRLREVHSVVPLAEHHSLSIGVVTVAGNVCFGITCDPATFPDPETLAGHIDTALDELLDDA